MKRLCKLFYLSTLFSLLSTLIVASSTVVAQVVPTGDGNQPHGYMPRISENTNVSGSKTQPFTGSTLTKAISFVVSCGLTYLVKEIIWRVVPNGQKQRERIKKQKDVAETFMVSRN